MTAREQMLEQEVKELREEIRLLRLVTDGHNERRRLILEDSTPRPGRVDAARVVVFQAEDGWRWTASDTNGENVADSGDDGYVERATAMQAARDLFPNAEVVEVGPSAGELD
jgi:hypothetical protein